MRAIESVASLCVNARYETHAFDFWRVAVDHALSDPTPAPLTAHCVNTP
jgi:hypothetical protein